MTQGTYADQAPTAPPVAGLGCNRSSAASARQGARGRADVHKTGFMSFCKKHAVYVLAAAVAILGTVGILLPLGSPLAQVIFGCLLVTIPVLSVLSIIRR